MKLHLPIGLRVALFAVMAALPVTFGAVSASYTHGDGTTEKIAPESQEGNKGELRGRYTEGTVVLSVDDSTDDENAITELDFYATTQNATTSITISGNSFVSVDGGTIGLVASSSQGFGESFSNISVTGGGSFHMSGTASTIGRVGSEHGISHTTIEISGQESTVDFNQSTIGYIEAHNGESHTEITITDHGKFEVKYDSKEPFSIGTVYAYDSSSFTTITVSGEGEFLLAGERDTVDIGRFYTSSGDAAEKYTGRAEIIINVNESGKFTHQGGSIATCSGVYGSGVANGADIPETDLKINVNGGVYAIEQKKEYGERWIGYADASWLYAASANTVINVTNGGQFNIDGSGVRMAYANAQSSGHGAEATLEINVSGKDSVFFIEPEEEGTSPEIYIGDTADGTTSVTVDVSQGGSFSMLSKAVGSGSSAEVLGGAYATTSKSENPASSTVNIKLHDQGAMTLQVADHSTMSNKNRLYSLPNGIGICRAISGGEASVETTISVGNQSTFEFKSGEIGMAYISGASTATSTTSIIVEEGGTFTMEDGYLSHSYVASAATGSVNQTLSIDLKGGNMTITGGHILTSDAGSSAGKRSGSIDISGDSVLSIGEGVTIGDIEFAVTMHGGTLAGKGISQLTVSIDTGEGFKGTVDLGGLSGEKVSKVKINEAGATVTEIGKETTLKLSGEDNVITIGSGSAELTAGGETIASDGKDKGNIINFQEGGGTIQLEEGSTVTLRFGEDEFLGHLSGKEKIKIQVHLANAELLPTDGEVENYFKLEAGWGLYVDSYEFDENGNAILTLAGNTTGVVDLNGEESDFSELEDADKVIVTENTTLTSTEGGTLNRLTGDGDDDNLTVTGKGKVELYNDGDLFNENGDTTFGGKLATEKDITLEKTGEDSLTLGSLEAEGNVAVEEGKLVLSGNDHSIGGKLTLGDKGALQVDGKLTLSGTSDLSEDSDKLSGDGTIVVDDGGSLTLSSDVLTDENGLSFGATKGGRLEFTGNAPVDLEKLAEGTTGTVAGSFKSNNPAGATFAGSVEGTLTVDGGSLNMSNTENSGCDLYVVGKDTQATIAAGSKYNSITVGDNDHDNDKLIVTAAAAGNKAGAGIQVTEDIVFRKGSETDFTINLSDPNLWGSDKHDATMLSTTKTIYIEPGTKFVIDGIEETLLSARENLSDVVILHGATIKNEDYKPSSTEAIRLFALVRTDEAVAPLAGGDQEVKADVVLGFTLNQLYENASLWMTDNGDVVFNADRRTDSKYASYAKTANGKAGLNLLWQNYSKNNGNVSPEEQAIMQELEELSESHNAAEASRVMAAVAGSTLTSVSAAQSAALRNQMGRVRDHALQAARLRCMGNDEATATQRPCKNSHVWVEGTSFFSEQHSVGDESGYRLNSWGGAVGIDAQVDAHWSVGVSLSASYGDLEAHAADDAKGDLDTYTVSFWSQAKNGRWGNTLLFTLGTNEADLKRTVNYGAGSYTATSNASGSSLGAMWELTYDLHPVKDNKSNILQPLFNVAVMHTSMDGFSEKNAGNVGLAAEKQTRDTMTLGLGLRWLAAINSAKAVNRTVSTEVHANVAQDLGDRRSVANVALLADPNFTQSVYGSKTGSTAFQFGAGVNVPVTPNSQIYVNAGGELREHANAWNAALGVRMGF